MFEKNLHFTVLFDLYGELLTEAQNKMFDYYYNDDLSLSEIADGVGISRQGVRHLIKKGEEHLMFLEERLGLAEHSEALDEAAERIDKLVGLLGDGKIESENLLAELKSIGSIIRAKNGD